MSRKGHDTRNTYKYGLLYGPKGNRIYEKEDPLSPAIRSIMPSLPPSRRNTKHMPDSTWLHDSGVPPCDGCDCD